MSYGIPAPAYRLPSEAHPVSVRLQVSDLGRSLAYYQDVLGLRLVSRTGSDVALAPYGDPRPLVHLHPHSTGRPAGRTGQRLGLYHFALVVPDRASLGRFLAHLSRVGVHMASADHAVSEALYLWDPDGLGIEVYADRPRETWRANGAELYMTTERLDLRGLTAAAGGVAWSGMPAGTSLGHMHLHVGNLEAAEAFYHRALGFDKTVWSYPGALFLSAGGYHHHLGTNTWAANASVRGVDEPGLAEWTIALPRAENVEEAAASCRAGGYDVQPGEGGVVISDPWGTVLRLTSG